jgi:riboflavin synthase
MFTGIIETTGHIVAISRQESNVIFQVKSSLSSAFRVDQSVAHNGVCLTVTAVEGDTHLVTAIQETLDKTNVGHWQVGTKVNIERCMAASGRFDGHIVQGHVDQTARCTAAISTQGSWRYSFAYSGQNGNITVEKGSICVNGVSLTVVNSGVNEFSVAIIPYTYEHTSFHQLKEGDTVNLEFDIVGKYIQKIMNLQSQQQNQ